jgi:hypothetical protein
VPFGGLGERPGMLQRTRKSGFAKESVNNASELGRQLVARRSQTAGFKTP